MLVESAVLRQKLCPDGEFSSAVEQEALSLSSIGKLREGDKIAGAGNDRGVVRKVIPGSKIITVEMDSHGGGALSCFASSLYRYEVATCLREREIVQNHPQLQHCQVKLEQDRAAVLEKIKSDGAQVVTCLIKSDAGFIKVADVLQLKAIAVSDRREFPSAALQWMYIHTEGNFDNFSRVFFACPPVSVARASERIVFVGTNKEAIAYAKKQVGPHADWATFAKNIDHIENTKEFWFKFFNAADFLTSAELSIPKKIVTAGHIKDGKKVLGKGEEMHLVQPVTDHLRYIAKIWGVSIEVLGEKQW